MGNIQKELGRVTASINSYEKSVELNPRYSETHLNLGRSYLSLRNFTQAQNSLEKAIELDRRNYLAFYNKALLHEELGDIDGAIESYLRALRIEPNHAESNNNLGKIFLLRDEPKRASKLFDRAISFDGKHTQALINQGEALSKLGMLDEAIVHLSQALILQPKNSEAADLLDTLQHQVA